MSFLTTRHRLPQIVDKSDIPKYKATHEPGNDDKYYSPVWLTVYLQECERDKFFFSCPAFTYAMNLPSRLNSGLFAACLICLNLVPAVSPARCKK